VQPETHLELAGKCARCLHTRGVIRAEVVQGLVQLDGCQERPSGMVLLGEREAKQGHEASLCEVLYGAGIALDVAQGKVEKPMSQAVHDRGSQGLG